MIFRTVLNSLILIVCSLAFAINSPAQTVDILIKNGRILDGTGNPWHYADLAIDDGKIVWMGPSSVDLTAREVIDADGLYIAPGFIDVHSHASSGLISESLSHGRPLLAQGITTAVVNPDGGGSVDIAHQRERLLEHGLGVNVIQLVPHGTVRREVMGMTDRDPTAEELEQMKTLVENGMKEGAFGLSSGLFYTPGAYAETEEIIELAKVVSQYNGLYTSHIRDESDYSTGVVASVDEVIRIAREAEIPGIVTHIKALGTNVWGYSAPLVLRIERARNEGVEVFADQYPYPASSTNLTAVLIPSWAREGGRNAMIERLDDPETLEEIKLEMVANLERRGGAHRIQISRYGADPSLEGQTLDVIANQFGTDAIDAALKLIEEETPGIVSFNMHEDDVARFMKQPWTMTGSDGGLAGMGEGVPHPRNYGTFPRKIHKYVVSDNVIDLPFAIRSMTSLPASVFGMENYGLIRTGAVADIVLFDLNRVQDLATYQDPHQLSEGMIYVLINGKFALKDGVFMPELHGRVLQKIR